MVTPPGRPPGEGADLTLSGVSKSFRANDGSLILALAGLSLTVRADSVKNPLTSWWVGDDARVTLPDTFVTMPGGTRDMRVIKASGGLNEQVAVELQEGQWFRPTDAI